MECRTCHRDMANVDKPLCPLCRIAIANVKRHLRGPHRLSRSAARRTMSERKEPSLAKSAAPLTWCPVPHCYGRGQRIDQHLKRVHGLRTDSVEFRVLMAQSKGGIAIAGENLVPV